MGAYNAEMLFTCYNSAVEEGYGRFMKATGRSDILRSDEDELELYLKKWLRTWETTPCAELGGLSPYDCLSAADSLEELKKMFIIGAGVCDYDIPEMLSKKLAGHGEAAVDFLVKTAYDYAKAEKSEDYAIAGEAIRLLGQWRVAAVTGILLDIMHTVPDSNELILERAYEALAAIGSQAASPVIMALDAASDVKVPDEYLYMVLKEIGSGSRSDSIYECLKRTFLRMNNKVLGALCLGEYGDPRAITFLRGYVNKNKEAIDNETFYQIKAAVNMLGGNMDDLRP